MPHPSHSRQDLSQRIDGTGPLGHGLLRRRGRPPCPAPRRFRQDHRPDPSSRADVHLFPHRLLPNEREAACHRREHLLAAGRARRRLHRRADPADHDHRAGPGVRPGAVRDGARGREAHRLARRQVRFPPLLRRLRGPLHRRPARTLDNGDLQRRASPTITSSSSPTTSGSAKSIPRAPTFWRRRTT
jgi:hypothetical protein